MLEGCDVGLQGPGTSRPELEQEDHAWQGSSLIQFTHAFSVYDCNGLQHVQSNTETTRPDDVHTNVVPLTHVVEHETLEASTLKTLEDYHRLSESTAMEHAVSALWVLNH